MAATVTPASKSKRAFPRSSRASLLCLPWFFLLWMNCVEDASLSKKPLLRIVPVLGKNGDREQIHRRQPVRVLLQYFGIDRAIAMLGDGFLYLISEKELQVGSFE
jgi:hypothetical protein